MTERELFEAVLDYPTAERARYLDDACGGDPERRARVDALLARHVESISFLEKPALALDHTDDYRPISEKAGTLIGPYKLLQQIGEGGFGCVFMAEQEKPVRRKVALKIIKPGMDSAQVIARFESERQALALMDHPNIAKVLDAGTTASGLPYFVMELVKGVPITEFCDKNHMPAEGRLKLFIDVCHAIQHAHHKGVIHRDIKPSNVMVTLHDGTPVVKVIDFGVAKATVQKLTERTLFTAYGQMIGTPAYMSPEQAEMSGLDIDTRSDVYSLGVLLYELLTGTTPLDIKRLLAAGYAEIQRLIREEEAPRPSTRMSSLGDSATILAGNRGLEVKKLTQLLAGDLDWLVMKALDKDRNRRYDTPGNFAEDIERFLNREAILARPPSMGYKIQKFVQRNKAAALTAVLIAMTLLIGIAGTSIGFFRAEQRRSEAEQARAEESKQRNLVSEEQKRTQVALQKSQLSEAQALYSERHALRQAAFSNCDVAQQLCERGSMATGLNLFGLALKYAHDAKYADLEDAIRWKIGTWMNELHPLAYTVPAPGGHGSKAAFHPNGKILAVGCPTPKFDGVVIQLYSAADGTPGLETVRINGPSRIYRMMWQPQGGHLGIYTGDGRVHLWMPGDASPTNSFIIEEGAKYADGVEAPKLAFSPDGSLLIAGTAQSVVKIFDVTTGKPTGIEIAFDDLHPESHATPAVDWSRDGSHVIAGNHNGVAKICDAKTGNLVREIVIGKRGLHCLRFSPDGKMFVSGSGFGIPQLQVWNTHTGEPVGPPMNHRENVEDADFSPDGKLVVAVDAGCEAFVWEVGTSRLVGAPIWTGGHSSLTAFHPFGNMLLTHVGRKIAVWSLGSGIKRDNVPRIDPEDARIAPFVDKYKHVVSGVEIAGKPHNYTKLALSPDGKRLIKYAFFRDVPVEIIDPKTLESIRVIPGTLATPAVYWKPDSTEFITATWRGPSKIRDAATGVAKADIGYCEPWSGAFSPDGSRFAIATRDYSLRFFDTTSWKMLDIAIPHTSRVQSAAYSRDGKIVFTADSSLTTRIWHPGSRKRIGPPLIGGWPIIASDNRTFTTWDGNRSHGYQLPSPIAGEVAEVYRKIESLTGKQGMLSEEEPDTAPSVIGPGEAMAAVGQNVILEMTVRSFGFSKVGEWMYLNSELDHKNPKNMTVAIKYPTPERRKAMNLDRENEKIVGLRVRVTGKVTLYFDAPQIIVAETEQLEILPAKAEDQRH